MGLTAQKCHSPNIHLTAQMWQEMNSINNRTLDLIKQAFTNYPHSFRQVQIVYRDELSANKIKLEMLFSETEDKEQSEH